jgi:hypothetical protein
LSTDPSILLRLLEPAVRPDRIGGAGNVSKPAPGGLPFEQTTFDELLKDARQAADPARAADVEASKQPPVDAPVKQPANPLAALADFGRIENAYLRDALGAKPDVNQTDD